MAFDLSFSPRHTTPEKFFIEACDEGADAVLAIDRVSNEMTLTGRKSLEVCFRKIITIKYGSAVKGVIHIIITIIIIIKSLLR